MLRVGLTGGIACGKSRVLARFAARGFSTLDLDRVSRSVVETSGEAHADVVAAFGPGVVDDHGGIDRKALGAIVFADAAARAVLNEIVHPRVREVESRWAAEEGRRGARAAVTDAALLVESGVHLRFDRLVVVNCGAEEQIRRLMQRDGLDASAARARIAAQMPVEEKRTFGHFEVDACGAPAATDLSADAVADRLDDAASAVGPRRVIPVDRALGALLGADRGPRGLAPVSLLRAIVSWGGLEMERAARLLVPAAVGPWYRQAGQREGDAAPATLAAAVVLWSLSRGAPDDDYLASAAASLARLTHAAGAAVADAVAVALALQNSLLEGRAPATGWAASCPLASRWGGAPPSARLENDFAALLSGAARGESEADAPAEALEAVRAIRGLP